MTRKDLCSVDYNAWPSTGEYSNLKPVDPWADIFWAWTFWHPPGSSHVSGVLLANLFLWSPWTMRKHVRKSNCFHHHVSSFFCCGNEFQGADTPRFHPPSAWAFHTTWWVWGEIWKGLYWHLCSALGKSRFPFAGFLRCLLVPFIHIYFLICSVTKGK